GAPRRAPRCAHPRGRVPRDDRGAERACPHRARRAAPWRGRRAAGPRAGATRCAACRARGDAGGARGPRGDARAHHEGERRAVPLGERAARHAGGAAAVRARSAARGRLRPSGGPHERRWQAPMKILVTGTAGFIGFHTAQRFLARGDEVVGLDSLNEYYDVNTDMPFSEHRIADHPLSLYAATKRANELMAHNYSSLFKLPTTGLRFFTVYGPWGRPDMALFLFTRNILEGKPIDVFNRGH